MPIPRLAPMPCRLVCWNVDTTRFHKGDVVNILPAGAHAGGDVEGHPDWTIVEAPNDAPSYQYLLATVRYEDGSVALHRAAYVDLDQIPAIVVIVKPVPIEVGVVE